MSGILSKTLADLRRRRLQTAIVLMIALLASGVTTLALMLLTQAGAPYDRAFAQQRGAHLLAIFDASRTAPAQLRATARLRGVTAASGPWPDAQLTFEPTRLPAALRNLDQGLGPPKIGLRVVGRAMPGGPVDRLDLVAGRWARSPDEIVLTRSFAEQVDAMAGGADVPLLGGHLRALDALHPVTFTVVGEVIDVNEADASLSTPQQAWVLPAAMRTLVAPGSGEYEMAYRFGDAPSAAQVQRQLDAINAALPSGALARSYAYQDVRRVATITTSLVLTFVVAFSAFALLATALIVANVVAGAVLAGYREIGIMKAIGFTPGEVMGVLTGQMLLPALAGSLIGIPLGALLSRPLLDSNAHAMGLPAPAAVSPAMDLLALAGVLLVVALSAIVPAWRAGKLSAIRAITLGTAPERPRRSRLGRAAARLGLSRTLSLGASEAFVRPLRGALTAIAILIGVATLTFAYGFHATLSAIDREPTAHSNDFVGGAYQVEVSPISGIGDARITRLLRAQPETTNVVAFGSRFLAVPGLSDTVQAVFVRGDATRLGYRAITGRWFSRPGEAVAAAAFIKEAQLHIGDRFTATLDGRRIQLRLVGEDFDLTNQGRVIRADWASLIGAEPGATPDHYAVQLRTGTDPGAFGHRLLQAEPRAIEVDLNNSGLGASLLPTLNGVVGVLAAVLCLIAVAGVFNTMLLSTHERVRDTAVLKALGMEPRQVVAMVAATACVLGLTGGVLGLPAGVALQGGVVGLIGALAGNTIPIDTAQAFAPAALPALALTGVLVALAGALLPARWAARAAVTTVLRTE